ncbi:NAD(P)-dependent dehydrogenase (short-subunit alcohol dehydrogenase family) [Streptomyces sp. SAI-163]
MDVADDPHRRQDPTDQYPRPEFAGQDQPHPGWTGPMDPPPDHGEESYRGSGRLAGRRAVITGGDSGIGRAVALAYAREGADVLFTYLEQERDEARETSRLVEDAGQKAVAVSCDIREEHNCRALVDRAVAEFGGIDVLVNNAAYQMSQPDGIEAITTEQFDRVMRTNLYGMFWLTKFALPHMPEGGSVINTTSVQAYKPSPHLLDYAMTKGAIVTFTQGLAQMVVERGIRVNAVAPGPVWTPLIPATLPDTTEFGKQSPLGRPAQPAELAPAYVYLASQEAGYRHRGNHERDRWDAAALRGSGRHLRGSGRLGEFRATEEDRVAGGQLGEDAVEQGRSGETADDAQDRADVPACGGQGAAGAGGEVPDEGPAGHRVGSRDLGGEDPRRLAGETRRQLDAFLAGDAAAEGG